MLLGDFLRLSLRATGRPFIPLGEEVSIFRADRTFFSALRAEPCALDVYADDEAAAAEVPNGLLLSLLDESMIHDHAGTGERPCRIHAARVGDRLRIDVEAHPGNAWQAPGRSRDEGRLQERLNRLFAASSLSQEPLPAGLVRCRLEFPFLPADDTLTG